MPLFQPFAHYLGYLATDQETFRALLGDYDGVVVPATIAAWQQQGTGGFVTSLSVTQQSPPYIIDPRFPLFQQALPKAKASHRALADLLGDPSLVRPRPPSPSDFDRDRLAVIAEKWAEFNTQYTTLPSDKTFDKYARRLNEDIPREPETRLPPEAILPPYFAADSSSDAWWSLSKVLFEMTGDAALSARCFRVVCAKHLGALDGLLADVGQEQLVVWVSGLDEPKAPVEDLVAYRRAIVAATDRGQELFALYGGFLSVLLASAGLRGSAHGVGFSEHRVWQELPESGAPPARYYLRRAHRFIAPDLAQLLYVHDPAITACPCPHCDGRPPVELAYHDLMKHSVACRADEVRLWRNQPARTAADMLRDEHEALAREIRATNLVPPVRARAMHGISHLRFWADALAAPL